MRHALLLCLVAGCSSSGNTSQNPPDANPDGAGLRLAVASVSPADGSANNQASAVSISARLAEALDCTSVDNDSLAVERAGVRVAGTVACSGDLLTFTPSVALPTRTQLVATLASDVRAQSGALVGETTSWSFGMAGWTRAFMADFNIVATAVDASDNVYLAGYSLAALPGETNAGAYDVILIKLGPNGNVIWQRQYGSAAHDYALGVGADPSGSVYVGGMTEGALDGTSAGGLDFFIAKYAADGTRSWTRQLGSASGDRLEAMGADATGIYATGWTTGNFDGGSSAGGSDIVVLRYASDGTKQWTRQVGSAGGDYAWSLAATNGGVYVGGQTDAAFDGQPHAGNDDGLVLKYDAAGTKLWTKAVGTVRKDSVMGVGIDGTGHLGVVGTTWGSLAGTNPGPDNGFGDMDAFLLRWDGTPTQQWGRQFGMVSTDETHGGHVDAAGNIYVTGKTYNDLDGSGANVDLGNMFVAKYDATGVQQWIRVLASDAADDGLAVRTDSAGNVFVTGRSLGVVDGTPENSVFVVKYDASGVLQ